MKLWDKLPTVISCCLCCFLRAGTVMIGVFSFIVGVIFAPNVTHSPGFWNIDGVLSNNSATEGAIQMLMGVVSIMLCGVSVLLLIGALCNLPLLIEMYQWGAAVYAIVMFILYSMLVTFCFFVYSNYLAGGMLVLLIICNALLFAYFIMVANSLRVSLHFLNTELHEMSGC